MLVEEKMVYVECHSSLTTDKSWFGNQNGMTKILA